MILVETNGVCKREGTGERKWDIHGNCHPALFVIVIYFVGFPKTEKKTTTTVQRNAIMLAWIPKLIMCDWKSPAT